MCNNAFISLFKARIIKGIRSNQNIIALLLHESFIKMVSMDIHIYMHFVNSVTTSLSPKTFICKTAELILYNILKSLE